VASSCDGGRRRGAGAETQVAIAADDQDWQHGSCWWSSVDFDYFASCFGLLVWFCVCSGMCVFVCINARRDAAIGHAGSNDAARQSMESHQAPSGDKGNRCLL